jgi:hypothetical protein
MSQHDGECRRSYLVRGTEPVTDARLGQDVARLLRIGFDLVPQLLDVDPQVPYVGRHFPDLAEDELMGEHLTGVLHQQLQDIVLPGRKLHLCPLDLYEAADALQCPTSGTKFTEVSQSAKLMRSARNEQAIYGSGHGAPRRVSRGVLTVQHKCNGDVAR